MSRNPHATNLRHHKPKRIEDKRDKLLGKFYADPDERYDNVIRWLSDRD